MTSHRAGARSLRAIDAGEARASDVAVHHREPAAVPAALQASVTVAELLRDPERVAEAAVRSLADAPGTLMLPGWQPASQLLGHAGIAMLYGRLAEEDPAWSAVAHAHLAAAARAATAAGPAGAGDLLIPARRRAAHVGGYARLLARAAEVHASYTAAHSAALAERLKEHGPGLSYLDYDVIAGLTRHARTLLSAAAHGHEASSDVLSAALGQLVALTEPVTVYGRSVPGWWCAPERYVVPRDRAQFPRGDFNVGPAHGVCGPLALLSVARLAGHEVPGMDDAIRRITTWVLDKGRREDSGAERWPGRVAFEEETGAARSTPGGRGRGQVGWCYGTAGVAWSLYLAGRALDDPAVRARASAAVLSIFRDGSADDTGDDPGLCHGRAGLLHIGARMAAATRDPGLWRAVDATAQKLASDLDTRTAFGYRQVVRDTSGVARFDAPGLIDGAAGVALALHTYADARRGRNPGADAWDSAFLMS
ncbi:lanthionine synthetase C family protein [Streptomyces sp. NPDC017405]|uniref:lanthionine synthetase C family protein n=1 Tax=unclassified Streptomyces TaxID=2593676 RepID=UPI0037A5F3AB